jgi:hypothetical protein
LFIVFPVNVYTEFKVTIVSLISGTFNVFNDDVLNKLSDNTKLDTAGFVKFLLINVCVEEAVINVSFTSGINIVLFDDVFN